MITQDKQANELYTKHKYKPVDPQEEIQGPITFVTTLTKSYLPGLVRLIETLKENGNSDFNFIVITLDDVPEVTRIPEVSLAYSAEEFMDYFAKLGRPSGKYRSLEERVIAEVKSASERFRWNFIKCLVWGLPTKKKLFFIDSDIICTGDINEIRKFPMNITAVRNFGTRERSKREEMSYKYGILPIYNTGFFAFQPDPELHAKFMEFMIYGYTNHRNTLGDQPIINDFFQIVHPEKVNYAPYKFNYRGHLRGQLHEFGAEQTEIPVFFHFIHQIKPWQGEVRDNQRLAQDYFLKKITIDEFRDTFLGTDPYSKIPLKPYVKPKVKFGPKES